MESIVGIFNSLADAKRGAAMLRALGIAEDRISVLAPHTPDAEVEAQIPTTDTEQPGMGQAMGGTVGAALGVAGGATAGAAAASLLVPGVGPVLALGIIGAALLGAGGAAAGALAGDALEKGMADGLPHDEVYVYEDALRHGRSVVIAFADDEQIAENARAELARAGAESVDAAREEWWIGLRDAEQEHYTSQGGDFSLDEAKYRLGFEAALHPDRRGKSSEDVAGAMQQKYGDDSASQAFRQGYERGQRYHVLILETYQVVPREEKSSKRAA
ncbi:MAG: hypothetical protein QOH70_1723 [Blastocatellia bacterium]|jgi:hypothetical protein|nr:hypothetical protein [Blastocatellia bacterium]